MTIRSNDCQAPNCEKLRDKKRGSAYCCMHRVRRSRYKSLELPIKPKLPDGIFHICKIHGELNSLDSYKNPKGGHYSCLICRKISHKNTMERHPDKDWNQCRKSFYVRNTKLNINIKVHKDFYQKQFILQDEKCAICKNPETMKCAQRKGIKQMFKIEKPKRLAVDHDHKTNKIRGLLCHKCNVALGSFHDSIRLLESAIEYLKKSNND